MVQEYKALWNVPGGGAGFSTFYAETDGSLAQMQEFANNVRAFFAGVSTFIPNTVTITFESEVRTLNTATGTLEDVDAVNAPAQVTGVAVGAYAAGAGGRVDWRTSGIVAGRRVVGRTFLVPIIGTSFESNGTLVAGTITDIQADADAYLAAFTSIVGAVVWSRPVVADPTADPPIAARAGSFHAIQSATVPDKSALLRSRRD